MADLSRVFARQSCPLTHRHRYSAGAVVKSVYSRERPQHLAQRRSLNSLLSM
jgi:hypothetical protein